MFKNIIRAVIISIFVIKAQANPCLGEMTDASAQKPSEGMTVSTSVADVKKSISTSLKRQSLAGRYFRGFPSTSLKMLEVRGEMLVRGFLNTVLKNEARAFFKTHDLYRVDLIPNEGQRVIILAIVGPMERDNGRLIQLNTRNKMTDYWFEDQTNDVRIDIDLDAFYKIVFSR